MPKSTAAQPPHILVFDSGVGGLSIVADIRQTLPNVSITYASDNAFFPYGIKEDDLLIARVTSVIDALSAKYTPDIIVIACNTASTVVLPSLRATHTLPIVGVVPAIKPAAEHSQSKVIGLIATPATVRRRYTQELIDNFASDCEVLALGSGDLVTAAEAFLRGEQPSADSIQAALSPILTHPLLPQLDTVVLACTHFPLIKAELSQHFDQHVQWLDSGKAIARRVDFLLQEAGFEHTPLTAPTYRSVFTKDSNDIHSLHDTLRHRLSSNIEIVSVA
ncbi:glutamate racemase [Aurantivibrio plasticivorans]